MTYMLVLFPMVIAAVTFAMPSNRWRPWLLPVGALGHLALVAVGRHPDRKWGRPSPDWVAGCSSTRSARSSLGFISLLFFLCSLYAPGYLALRA